MFKSAFSARAARMFGAGAAVALAALTLAACVAPSGEAVHANRPSVSYAYASDRDLVDISRRAEAYCRSYGGWPRMVDVVNRGDGQRTITYECDPTTTPPGVASAAPPATAAPAPPTRPGVSYSYRTDQDLVEATQRAEAHCRQAGGRTRTAGIANITTNSDGSRTVYFTCERPL
jgi:putative hemolysin